MLNIEIGMVVRHVKRGTHYRVEGRTSLQIGSIPGLRLMDLSEVLPALEALPLIRYKALDGSRIGRETVRPEHEFRDGRFVEVK